MDEQENPLSLVLFSGTDDKLTAAAVLAVGAAAMDGPSKSSCSTTLSTRSAPGEYAHTTVSFLRPPPSKRPACAATRASTGASC